MKTRFVFVVVAGLALGLTGCEESRNNSSWDTNGYVLAASTTMSSDAHGSRGIGAVKQFDLESIPASRAVEGQALFLRRCSACHKLDEKFIGPALKGVTERREPEWILNWILNTDIMVQRDPMALELLKSFMTQMTNQKLDMHDAESVLAFFREYDRGHIPNPQKPAAAAAEATTAPADEATEPQATTTESH